jgi:hypothetical protein
MVKAGQKEFVTHRLTVNCNRKAPPARRKVVFAWEKYLGLAYDSCNGNAGGLKVVVVATLRLPKSTAHYDVCLKLSPTDRCQARFTRFCTIYLIFVHEPIRLSALTLMKGSPNYLEPQSLTNAILFWTWHHNPFFPTYGSSPLPLSTLLRHSPMLSGQARLFGMAMQNEWFAGAPQSLLARPYCGYPCPYVVHALCFCLCCCSAQFLYAPETYW